MSMRQQDLSAREVRALDPCPSLVARDTLDTLADTCRHALAPGPGGQVSGCHDMPLPSNSEAIHPVYMRNVSRVTQIAGCDSEAVLYCQSGPFRRFRSAVAVLHHSAEPRAYIAGKSEFDSLATGGAGVILSYLGPVDDAVEGIDVFRPAGFVQWPPCVTHCMSRCMLHA
jgi:hypothetical protein